MSISSSSFPLPIWLTGFNTQRILDSTATAEKRDKIWIWKAVNGGHLTRFHRRSFASPLRFDFHYLIPTLISLFYSIWALVFHLAFYNSHSLPLFLPPKMADPQSQTDFSFFQIFLCSAFAACIAEVNYNLHNCMNQPLWFVIYWFTSEVIWITLIWFLGLQFGRFVVIVF